MSSVSKMADKLNFFLSLRHAWLISVLITRNMLSLMKKWFAGCGNVELHQKYLTCRLCVIYVREDNDKCNRSEFNLINTLHPTKYVY